MSKLDELIKEFCPNGVEYKRIEEVTNYKQPSKYIVKSTEYDDSFSTPVLTAGQTFILGYTNETDGIFQASKDNPVVIFDDFTGAFKWVDFPFKVKSSAMKIITTNEDKVPLRYLFHVMGFLNFSSDEHKRLWISIYSQLSIPVPPLEVQCEIVRILDSFTLLTAELTAELTARKKQYEYYRDELLKPNADIPMVKLKEIAISIYRGAGIKRDQVTEDGIPCVRYGEIYTTYNTWFDECVSHTKEEYVPSPKYFEHGDILFAITGESVEDIAKSITYVGHDKCLAGGDIVVMKHEQNPRYLAHVLNTSMAREQKSRGKVKSKVVHSNVPSIEQIEIPLPQLDVQKRYAEVLDNFEKICNDLNIGLPAEIEARQKQYEFYRDQLLTFAETGRTILTDRQTDRQSLIKLLQYVFGYAVVSLDDISENFDSLRKPVTSGARDKGDVPYYGASGIVDYVKDYIFDGDYLLVSEDGANLTARVTPIAFSISGKTWVNNHAHVLRFEKYATRRFVEMYLNSIDLSSYITGAAQPKLNQKNLNKIEIPLPSLEEQERIVAILDRFDSLCNSISEGLPAEIEARQKQYEYYRDKLLNFNQS
jgi:type I restriction enzyme S subunit